MTPAVWDLDATVGNNWSTNPLHPDYVNPDNNLSIMNFYIYNRLITLNVDNFNEKVEKRYKELRRGLLSKENLLDRYNSYYQILNESGAAQREEQRWSKDTDLNGNELNFEKEIAYINQWIDARLDYLDSTNSPILSDMNPIPTFIKQKTNTIYNVLGQKINCIPEKGIYIINGKKYIK